MNCTRHRRHARCAGANRCRRKRAVGRPARRDPRHQRRLHAYSLAARGVPAGRADDAGAGARVDLRGGGHLLRRQARLVGGGHGRADRDLPVPAVLDRDGAGDGGHRDRRAAHRRAARRGRPRSAPCRRSSSRVLVSLPFAVVGIVCAQDLLRLMGADAWTHRTRLPLHAMDARRQRRHHAAVRHQRDLPRRRRRGGRDARAVGGQRPEHRARPDPDLRARADPGAGHRGRGDRHQHRPRHRRG